MIKKPAIELIGGIGERIREIRRELKIKQKQFADSIGVSACYLSEIENGKNKNPGYILFFNIASKYNVNLNYLLRNIGDIFLPDELDSEKDDANNFVGVHTVKDLIWLMKRSPLFLNSVMAMSGKFYLENDDLIMKTLGEPEEILK